MYDTLLIVHIAALAVWFGGGLALNVIATRTPPPDRAAVMPQVSFYGNTVLTPASLLLVLSGFGLVAELDLDMGDTWILLGILIWIATAGLGAAVIGPAAKRIAELSAQQPPDVAQMTALRARVLLFSRITLLLILLAIVDMITKPGL